MNRILRNAAFLAALVALMCAVRPPRAVADRRDDIAAELRDVDKKIADAEGMQSAINASPGDYADVPQTLAVLADTLAKLRATRDELLRESAAEAPRKPAPTKSPPPPKSKPKFALPKNFTIEGDPAYQKQVLGCLQVIGATKSGRQLIESLADSGRKLRIHADGGAGNWTYRDPPLSPTDTSGELDAKGKRGKPSDAEIGFDPDREKLGDGSGSVYDTAKWANPPGRTPDVGLFHEMVHADDFEHGRMDMREVQDVGPMKGTKVRRSELRAVGLIGNFPYTENSYRKERGLPKRDFY